MRSGYRKYTGYHPWTLSGTTVENNRITTVSSFIRIQKIRPTEDSLITSVNSVVSFGPWFCKTSFMGDRPDQSVISTRVPETTDFTFRQGKRAKEVGFRDEEVIEEVGVVSLCRS